MRAGTRQNRNNGSCFRIFKAAFSTGRSGSGTVARVIICLIAIIFSSVLSPYITLAAGSLSLDPVQGPPGTVINITGGGFTPSQAARIWFDSNKDGIRDTGEPSKTRTITPSGEIPAGTTLTVPAVGLGEYQVIIDVYPYSSNDAWADFTVTKEVPAAIALEPPFGSAGVIITITGEGFGPEETGWIWFDTDGDGVRDTGEPEIEVNTSAGGEIPSGTSLTVPPVSAYMTYQVRADIPGGGSIEAAADFTTGAVTALLTVTRHDPYGAVIGQITVDYRWLESNLTVYGDTTTHWYLQGIDETGTDPWNPAETINIKDWGTNRGTDLKDLCNLAGGMSPGDTVKITASDGWNMTYDYPNVYEPEERQGRILVCWWNNDSYVPYFADGMRMLFLADTSTNPSGLHIFGNWDQHECFPESRWYFFNGELPTTTGHSGKYIRYIDIYQSNLLSCDEYGNPKEDFEAGEGVYVRGYGLDANTDYDLWILPEPVLYHPLGDNDIPTGDDFLLTAAGDPSGTQETVTTDGIGDFGPALIWTIPSGASTANFDIVADNRAAGTVGVFDIADAIDNPGRQGFTVTEKLETISFTITDYGSDGIRFGNLDPGGTGTADRGEGGAVTITVGEETNVGVDIQVMGTDFFGTGDTIPVRNIRYNSVNSPDGARELTTEYFTWYSVLMPLSGDHVTQVYYWITIPAGKTAGEYSSTFFYKAVEK